MVVLNKYTVKGWRDTKHILELLQKTAEAYPQRLAYADELEGFTWSDTLSSVQKIASALHMQGVQGKPVAVYMERNARCTLAVLGVLGAGGFYTVLDISQPENRLLLMTDQLKPAAILTDDAHLEAARQYAPSCLTWEQAMQAPCNADEFAATLSSTVATDLAYVLFTSGSTGLPKGVAVTHQNVLAYSAWVQAAFAVDETYVFGSQTPFYFSMSVTDIYGALRTGACVQIIPKRLFSFPVQLLDYLTDKKVNILYWVPAALNIVANWQALDYTALPLLHTILFAGEVMPTKQLNYWRSKYPSVRFANLYGPTETTDICAFYVLDRAFANDEALPIGYACADCGLLVLCDDETQAAQGEEGELCVRGPFVTLGYYDAPEKTAERFVQNPLQSHYPEIIYRTGDLVRQESDGRLLYCGRRDNQIKHMGYRIEPGEIETAASGMDAVESCACLYDDATDRIMLFFQAKKDVTQALREHLVAALPTYMRPAVLSRQKRMPQNANGKIDRIALTKVMQELNNMEIKL